MIDKQYTKHVVLVLAVVVVLAQLACSLFSRQTIYDDPEHVDFSAEETETPEAQAQVEEPEPAEADDVEPDAVAAPADEVYFEQGAIKLYYDPQLVLDIDPPTESIPVSSGGEMYEMAHPTFVHFDLYMEQAHVYIAPVQEYEAVADFAPEIIADLQRLIDSTNNNSDCVPELPLDEFFHACDHQQFNANLSQLDFQNGSGVRFVSVYGIQDISPVDNEHLVYVFQGFTKDGKYYIKAVVRLFHDQLPEVGEIPAEVYSSTDANAYAVYFDDFELLLNQNEADYSPTLEWIDAFLSSLRVE
jgi:hypothetical protein